MTAGVYAVINRRTQRAYIGSSADVAKRLVNQKSFLKTGHRCAIAALKNQPIDIGDFEFRVLARTNTVSEAQALGSAVLECFWGDWPYNRSKHIDGSTGVKRNSTVYASGAKKQWADPPVKGQKSVGYAEAT